MRAGDVLLVNSLDRLGDDTHLITLINDFGERGIDLRSLTEPAIDTTSSMGRALYGIMAVLAQLRDSKGIARTRLLRQRETDQPVRVAELHLELEHQSSPPG